jgi:hypothetical protein
LAVVFILKILKKIVKEAILCTEEEILVAFLGFELYRVSGLEVYKIHAYVLVPKGFMKPLDFFAWGFIKDVVYRRKV